MLCPYLKDEIVNSKTFQNTPISEIDITNKHGLSTQPLSATPTHWNIPTIYWLPN